MIGFIFLYCSVMLIFRVLIFILIETDPYSGNINPYSSLSYPECWGRFIWVYILFLFWPTSCVWCTYKYLTRNK